MDRPVNEVAPAPQVIEAFNVTITCLISTRDTNDAVSLMRIGVPPHVGPPLHIHQNEDEIFYVLAGKAELQIGATRLVLGPGDSAFGPRGVPHTFRAVGPDPLDMLVYLSPGRFEDYFRTVAAACGAGDPDPDLLEPINTAFAISFVGPPLQ